MPLFRLSLDCQDPLGVGEVVLQERVLREGGHLWQPKTRPQAHFHSPLPRHTHIKGLTKGIVIAKNGVGDRHQGGAVRFLPRGEVVLSIVFRLGEKW